jgi:hypothetical protein
MIATNRNLTVKLLTESDARKEVARLIDSSKFVDFAVAWAGKNKVFDLFSKASAKFRHVTVGTHMYQTDPHVLRELMPYRSVHYMPPNGRLFHPKVYIFFSENLVAAIVGSHNLTAGAFEGRNIEASVLLVGDGRNETLQKLSEFVRASWTATSPIDEEFLFSYEIQHKANKSTRNALERFQPLSRPRNAQTTGDGPLSISWGQFVRRVENERHHKLEERLLVLERARALFGNGKTFEKMTREERRAIAGTYGRKEPTLGDLPWGWFGTMFGMGDFKNLVSEAPHHLSEALEHIPSDTDPEESDYSAFARAFRAAFRGKAHKGGIATASRLLVMRRPDIFVGINNANKQGVCDAFGVAHTTLSLDNYWERVIAPIQLCPWWLHRRPRNSDEGRIWDNRAALIDCIYYEETDG